MREILPRQRPIAIPAADSRTCSRCHDRDRRRKGGRNDYQTRNRRPHDLDNGTLAEAMPVVRRTASAPDGEKHSREHTGGDERTHSENDNAHELRRVGRLRVTRTGKDEDSDCQGHCTADDKGPAAASVLQRCPLSRTPRSGQVGNYWPRSRPRTCKPTLSGDSKRPIAFAPSSLG